MNVIADPSTHDAAELPPGAFGSTVYLWRLNGDVATSDGAHERSRLEP